MDQLTIIIIIAVILVLIALGVGFYILLYTLKSNQSPDAIASKKEAELAELKVQLQHTLSEKDELAGKGKEMFNTFKNTEADLKIVRNERDQLKEKLANLEAERTRFISKQEDLIEKQSNSNEALIKERERVIREAEAVKAAQEADRDRQWNEHEQTVIAQLRDVCKQPQLGFETYENNNLPEGFHGSFKPDFMISFLNQYVIFDAKVSKSGSMQTYVNEQVKKTVEKVKKNNLDGVVYNSIYLVIPSFSVSELKKTIFYEEGYNVFVVGSDALAPILHSLKRIEQYEFAEQMDPLERENIVDMLAQLDFHISSRNAVDFALMQHGLETLSKTKQLPAAMQQEIQSKKNKMRTFTLATAELKKLTAHPQQVHEKLQELVEPSAQIDQQSIPGFESKKI